MRAASIVTLRPEAVDGYRAAHKAVWPDLVEAARKVGIHNHSVFLHGQTLIIYLEATDVDESLAALKQMPVKQRWDHYMEQFMEPGEAKCEEVFFMP